MVSTHARPAETLKVGLQDSIPAATKRAMLMAVKWAELIPALGRDKVPSLTLKYLT